MFTLVRFLFNVFFENINLQFAENIKTKSAYAVTTTFRAFKSLLPSMSPFITGNVFAL